MSHGETHTACDARFRNNGGNSECCLCKPHEGCKITSPNALPSHNVLEEEALTLPTETDKLFAGPGGRNNDCFCCGTEQCCEGYHADPEEPKSFGQNLLEVMARTAPEFQPTAANFVQEAGRTHEATTSTTSSGGSEGPLPVLPPTPPNEVDELDRIKTHFTVTETGEVTYALLDEASKTIIRALITKQSHAYHAAGLRELKKDIGPGVYRHADDCELVLDDDSLICDCGVTKFAKERERIGRFIDEAIAKEESK